MLGGDFQLGEWRVSADSGVLTRGDRKARLQPQVARLLAYLAGRPGRVVSKQELLREVWDDRFVGDAALTSAVWELRGALGDDAKSPRFIETVPRRGYRLLAHPTAVPIREDAEPSSPIPRRSSGRRSVPIALAVLLTTALAAVLFARWRPGPPVEAPPIAVAVLPIQDFSQAASEEYLADGLTESLITELARHAGLQVTSRTSVMAYRGETRRVPEIARDLGVAVVLEGAVTRSHDRLRLTAHLIDARSDRHLWSRSYERTVGDLLALEDELARTVARDVRLRLARADATHLRRDLPEPGS